MEKIDSRKAMDFLKSHDRFLLIGHVRPDGDDVGSMVALHNVLLSMGKKADMVLGDPVPSHFRFLDAAPLVMTAIPEDASYDALVFTDLSNIERGGNFDFPKADSLCIDHHVSNTGYTDYLYLQPDYAATAEMLAEMFFDEGLTLSEDTCNALYMGMATDSGFFRFECTKARTLALASRLVGAGAKPAYISNHLDTVSQTSMQVYRMVLDTLHYEGEGKIALAVMDEKAMALDGENADYYVSIPRKVEGVEIGILFKCDKPDVTRVSFRSRRYADVAELASRFGGGGHVRAAGCTIPKPLHEAEADVIREALQVI